MSLLSRLNGIFRNNDVLLYTAIGDDDCMKVVGKLNDARIIYKSKSRGIYAGSGKRSMGFDTKLSQYDIYVNRDDEYKARLALEGN